MFNYLIHDFNGIYTLVLYTTNKKLIKKHYFNTYRECLQAVQQLQLAVREEDRTLRVAS